MRLILIATLAWSGAGLAPSPVPEEADAGLVREISDGERTLDVRVTRMPAFHSPARAWPDRPFQVRWTGSLNLDIRTRLTFSASGRGKVKVTIKGKVVLEGEAEDLSRLDSESQRIRKGANPVIVEYTPPSTGDATFRLYWEGKAFVREPVPPKVWTCDDNAVRPVERGRAVFAERRCVRCHTPAAPFSDMAMPELSAKGPSLERIRGRRKLAWVAEWLVNPRALRPDATMPALFGHASASDALTAGDDRPFDIVAYLSTLGGDPPEVPPAAKGGGRLFARLGCIGCHTRPEQPADPTGERVPLNRVGTRFNGTGALRDFLADPGAHYPWTRMPDFSLTADEAGALAQWLYHAAVPPPSPLVHSGDAERGRELVVEMGCVNCHDGLGVEAREFSPLKQLARADWSSGCVADEAQDGIPDFHLSDGERDALRALRSRGLSTVRYDTAAAFARRQIEALRCTACHAFDDTPDLWTRLITETHDLDPPTASKEGDEKISQIRPTLTWMGEKLHSTWTEGFLAGTTPAVRPWLQARMPAFPVRAGRLAEGMAQMHGFPVTSAAPPAPDAAKVQPGDQLLNKFGFGCTACHGIGDTPPYATFEFAAPNFDRVYRRLRPEYYTRWMWNPTRVEHRYKMPIYASTEDRLTLQEDILDGEADPQFEAMWHYIQSLVR